MEEESVRVLLVEDHAIFRKLFASIFEREPGFEVVAQTGSVAGAREVLEEAEPVDVAVLDLGLPDGEGTDLIGELHAENPHAAVLVLTGTNTQAGVGCEWILFIQIRIGAASSSNGAAAP